MNWGHRNVSRELVFKYCSLILPRGGVAGGRGKWSVCYKDPGPGWGQENAILTSCLCPFNVVGVFLENTWVNIGLYITP